MKKFLTIVLFMVIALTFSGCGNQEEKVDFKEWYDETYSIEYYTREEVDNLLDEFSDYLEENAFDELQGIIELNEVYINQLKLQLDEQQVIIEDLQARLGILETDFSNLNYLEGLNGQREYYVTNTETSTMQMGVVYLANDLDKNKLPSYMFDTNGNPVDFNYLGEALKLKYFEESTHIDDVYRTGSRAILQIAITSDMSNEEIVARLYAMVEELSLYDYWLIGASDLYITIVTPSDMLMVSVYMPSVRSEGFNLTIEDYYNEDWEIWKQFDFDLTTAQALYDQFVLDGTFNGNVLVVE